MSQEAKPYRYFDTPDGEDVDKKLWVVLKPTFVSAIAIATCDVMLVSHPKGYLKTLGRYAYITLPLLGISTAFVATTNLAASLRKKQDKVNWALGGLAAGGVLGAWRRSTPVGCVTGLAFALLGMGRKYAVDSNVVLLPEKLRPAHGAIRSPRQDWTLTKDAPGLWKQDN